MPHQVAEAWLRQRPTRSIARHVYPGIDAYARLRRSGASNVDVPVLLNGDEGDGRIRNGMDDYVIYSADKPLG